MMFACVYALRKCQQLSVMSGQYSFLFVQRGEGSNKLLDGGLYLYFYENPVHS